MVILLVSLTIVEKRVLTEGRIAPELHPFVALVLCLVQFRHSEVFRRNHLMSDSQVVTKKTLLRQAVIRKLFSTGKKCRTSRETVSMERI